MARVFLVNPPSPEPVRTPLLSFCHLAAALRAGGHDVALLDASAPNAPHAHAEIAERIAAFAPDLVGLHLKTLHVQPAYALAAALADRWVLVAGGPHATIVPDEPLAHGFRWVIRGEGEDAIVELADVSDGKRAATDVAGLSWIERGLPRHNPTRPFLMELDRLAPPLSALDLFDPGWYGAAPRPGGVFPPAGILASRGCPAACTFCSNDVTGRKFRYRSAGSVAAEVALLREQYGLVGFSFFDDSFAVGKRRVRELCDAIAGLGAPVWWTCTAHPAHLDRDVVADMKRAGCAGIDIGMESADPGMLLQIGKGVTVERVLDVLAWCRELGVHTVVNLMFGWPDETDAELAATIGFLERAAPIAGGFNARGVVVPYPGTQVYERNHERFGFTGWWIREAPLAYPVFPTSWDEAEIQRAYAEDPALDRNFFQHPPHRVARIREALAMKAALTMEIQRRRTGPTPDGGDAPPPSQQAMPIGVPAAGAR
ncbi:MAG: B12-binding domain-containing radical SAM protein [Myxococcota bacterium]|nr:B12-binding domain-containing radical SAM protein [Myxococcota bacterium]